MTKEEIGKDIKRLYKKYVREYKKTHDKGMTPACFKEWCDNEYDKRLEVFVGFNTKQWWVLDNVRNVLIDPPKEVLDKLPDWRENSPLAEEKLLEICRKEPSWLYDKGYWLKGDAEV